MGDIHEVYNIDDIGLNYRLNEVYVFQKTGK